MIRWISFDATNTLFRVHPSVGDQYASFARTHQLRCPAAPAVLEASFRESFSGWNQRAPGFGRRGRPPMTVQDFWFSVVRDTFRSCGCDVQDPQFESMFRDLFKSFASAQCWKLFPDTIYSLQTLRSRGHRLCVLSDFDSRLHPLMRSLGLDQYFEFIQDSYGLGFLKTEPEAFAALVRRCGVSSPAEVLHVGDDRKRDFDTPKAVGLHALLLEPTQREKSSTWLYDQVMAYLERCNNGVDNL